MPRPRNFWDVLGQSAGYAGESFGNALLQKQAFDEREDERQSTEDYRNQLMNFRRQQHADQIRQWEVEQQNKLLGPYRPVNYRVEQPGMPGDPEEALTAYVVGGGALDDPQAQNLLQLARQLENMSGGGSSSNQPNFVERFTEDVASRQADFEEQKQDIALADDVYMGGREVRPELTMSPPDISSMWWRRYVPQINAAGLNADSVRALLAPAYPQLQADRRPGVNQQPVNPEDTLNMLHQTYGPMPAQSPDTAGWTDEDQRRLEYLMSLQGE